MALFGFLACVAMAVLLCVLPVHVHPNNDPGKLVSCGSVVHPILDGADPGCAGAIGDQKTSAIAPAAGAGGLVLLMVVAAPSEKARRTAAARRNLGARRSAAARRATVKPLPAAARSQVEVPEEQRALAA